MKKLIPLLLLAVVGCATVDHAELDAKWRPLVRVQRDDKTPNDVYSTVQVTLVLTGDVSRYLALSEDEKAAMLVHERYHAQQQAFYGYPDWLRQFNNSVEFRRQEELAGWKLQLDYSKAHSIPINKDSVAKFLSSSYYGNMISYDAAMAWLVAGGY